MGYIINLIKNFNTYKNIIDYYNLRIFKQKNKIIKLKNNLKFYVRNLIDLEIINEIIRDRCYKIILNKNEKNLVIDVGAQIGIFSNYIIKKYPNTLVYAFEPVKNNFETLNKNIKLNKNEKKIKAINKAIFSYSGGGFININKNNSGGHSLEKKYDKKEKIKLISLNDFIKNNKIKKIDLLKLDCEGSEYEILFKLNKSNIKKIKVITMEYHYINKNKNLEKIKNFFKKNKFEIIKLKELDNEGNGLLTAIKKNSL